MKKEVRVESLITLCHILNDYNDFTKNLAKLIKTKYNRDIVYMLDKISNGEFVIGAHKVKKFYRENKSVIDTINKFSNISKFITYNYDYQGNLKEETGLDYFYEYITSHKEDLEKILSLLEKIKKLYFYEIEFDDQIDFTCDNYKMHTRFNDNTAISYLDNMEALPNYQNDIVEYRTKGSNYKIVVHFLFGGFSRYSTKTITVNSLLFDSKTLPEDITQKIIFDKILSLKKKQQENCENLKNSVDLSVSIDDLYSQLDITSKVAERINEVETKEQLTDLLLVIKSYLEQLQDISLEYDESILQNSSHITKEKLQEEKKLYLDRRK